MAKRITFRNRASSVLFWSIISAAFIGPGTVTTASKAGASFGLSLLFALLFSTIATIILQEAAARITIASGKNLGEILAIKFKSNENKLLQWGVFLAVAFGCAAYQAGNMLGAVSGLELVSDFSRQDLTLMIGLICFGLLWIGNLKIIANILGIIVAFMGIAFIYVAFQANIQIGDFFQNMLLPSFPENSSLLIIGLIGTTIVPYNLFLASGISKGQSISEMRWGMGIAVLIGGLISMAILVVGTQVLGAFSFENLAKALSDKLGEGGAIFFGFGLFAAGMSSSITSPLAAAVTAKSLLGDGKNWAANSKNFRIVWIIILSIGLVFGISEVKPIPVIILAQAINGALLPIVASFLLLAINDTNLIPNKHRNSLIINILTLIIVGLSAFLGIGKFVDAISKSLVDIINLKDVFSIGGTIILVTFLSFKVFRK